MNSRNLKAWFEGAPWVKEPLPFHDYFLEVLAKKRKPDSFLMFGDGIHELAHFLSCSDEHVLDPYWGLGDIGDPTIPPLTMKANLVELEAHLIYFMIESHTCGEPLRYADSSEEWFIDQIWGFLDRETKELYPLVYGPCLMKEMFSGEPFEELVVPGICEPPPDFIGHVKVFMEKWTIESLQKELYRKQRLVKEALS